MSDVFHKKTVLLEDIMFMYEYNMRFTKSLFAYAA